MKTITNKMKAPINSMVLAAIAVSLLYPVLVLEPLRENSDFPSYLKLIEAVESGRQSVFRAHFLFPSLVILFRRMLPILSVAAGCVTVTLFAEALLTVVLARLVRSSVGSKLKGTVEWKVIGLTLAIVLAWPIPLLAPWDGGFYFGYLAFHCFHNPTMLLMVPLAVIHFCTVVDCLGAERNSDKSFSLGILTILVTLAKPSYTVCIVPAILLFTLLLRSEIRFRALKTLSVGVLAPALVILLWQYFGLYTESLPAKEKTQIIFAPFQVVGLRSRWVFLKFLLSVCFPVVVAICYFRDANKDAALRLSWILLAVGAFFTYFIAESGARFAHGNFVWCGQIAAFLLFAQSTLFFLRQNRKSAPSLGARNRFSICAAVFSLHVIGGVIWYLRNIFLFEPQNFIAGIK